MVLLHHARGRGHESTALISSHTFDKCDYVWHAGYGPNGNLVSGYAVTFYFTGMFLSA